MNLLFLVFLAVGIAAHCECGYSVRSHDHPEPLLFTDAIESDFTKLNKLDGHNNEWTPQQFNVTAKDGRGLYGKTFLPENVVGSPRGESPAAAENAGLELMVASGLRDGSISGAEIDSKRLDLHWGSFRAGMKVTDVNGTCAAFFWYFNDTQEIDMEFLSREFDRENGTFPVNLVVQTELSKEAGFDASRTGLFKRVALSFDPTAEFHEYRFDYVPGKVVFYADGEKLAEMEGKSMPSSGGHLILQHWSNGNPLWSGGPPAKDAILRVSYVKAYFNSSEAAGQGHGQDREECQDRKRVCEVKDMTGGKAGDGETGDEDTSDEQDDEDDNGGQRMRVMTPMGWTATLATLVGLLD
ncbi:glycosyl hydrolases family 16 domain-containing protein [Sarocladium implicatum]|nr:glycosyl hydrolases family 16 domain-containing protein [Sarocladium implicatum]